jgi:hypothetical protein
VTWIPVQVGVPESRFSPSGETMWM